MSMYIGLVWLYCIALRSISTYTLRKKVIIYHLSTSSSDLPVVIQTTLFKPNCTFLMLHITQKPHQRGIPVQSSSHQLSATLLLSGDKN